MRLTKIAPIAGVAVLSAGMLTACGGSSDNSSKPAAGGESGASCPLVKATDPGNSKAPSGVPAAANAPKVAKKATYKVGFGQTESNNPWRLAETASMKDEAAKRGFQLPSPMPPAGAKQVADVKSMIAQKPDALFVAPSDEQPLTSSDAAKAGIPVFLIDRDVDHAVAKPGEDYVSCHRLGLRRGGQAGRRVQLAKASRRQGQDHRARGHHRRLARQSTARRASTRPSRPMPRHGRSSPASRGDFTRDKGRQVAETLLQAHPGRDRHLCPQ